jgi:hypothetical protein
MPYEGEYAKHRSIARIVSDQGVQHLLDNCRKAPATTDAAALPTQAVTRPATNVPRYVIAIDGGNQEIPIQNGYPGAEASFITVSSVLMDLDLLAHLDQDRPVDPVAFRDVESASSINLVLPGCNVVYGSNDTAESSFRQILFESMSRWSSSTDAGGETVLGTFEALMAHREDLTGRCPYEDCADPNRSFTRGTGAYACACPARRRLYCTDSLRIHEGIAPGGSSGKAFGEVRQVLEHLWLCHILRMLESRDMLHLLSQIALVIDGPLAVYGHPAWLSTAIFRELRRISAKLAERRFPPLLVMGVEKSGNFVDHFERLDIAPDGRRDRLPRQTAYLLDDEYIKGNIVLSESSLQYGHNTYYGRKLFYKTRSGARIVATIASVENGHRDMRRAEDTQFPRLSDAMAILDRLESSRYPNAVIPLSVAHAEAALPLNTGKKVLEELAKRIAASEAR